MRACYWISDDGQREVLLTDEGQTTLSDVELISEAMFEAKTVGLDLYGGVLEIGDWIEDKA